MGDREESTEVRGSPTTGRGALRTLDLTTGVSIAVALLLVVASRAGIDAHGLRQVAMAVLALGAVSGALGGFAASAVPPIGSGSRRRRSLVLRLGAFILLVGAVLTFRRYDQSDQLVPLRVVVLIVAAGACFAGARRGQVPLVGAGAREPTPSAADPALADGAARPSPASPSSDSGAPSARTMQIVGITGIVLAAGLAVIFAGPVGRDDATANPPGSSIANVDDSRSPAAASTTAPNLPLMIEDAPVDSSLLATLHFTDVSSEAGLTERQSNRPLDFPGEFAGGASIVDFDGDGRPDIYLPRVGLADILYRNEGDGTFRDVTKAAGLIGPEPEKGSSIATWGDVDGDGDPDLLLQSAEGARARLYQNDGGGSFSDATARSGIVEVSTRDGASLRYGSTFGDIDRDGDLDLVTLGQGTEDVGDQIAGNPCAGGQERVQSRSRLTDELPNRIWINDGTGRFADRTRELLPGFGGPIGFTPVLADIDGDGWLDLLATGDFCTSRVYRNDEGSGFTDVTARLGVGTDENGMGSAVEDIDGDGRLDWFVTSISYPPAEGKCPVSFSGGCGGNRLWINRVDQPWSDVTDDYGVRHGKWGWGIAASDLDNDGDRDLLTVNGNRSEPVPAGSPMKAPTDYWLENQTRLWLNTGTRPFVQAANEAGLTARGLAKSAIPFDYDGDGDLDLLVSRSESTPILYRNDLANGNSWLEVRLHDPSTANQDGVGARVEVRSARTSAPQVTEVRASGTYGGSVTPVAHFGLGPGIESVAEVVVQWPDGRRTTLTDVAANRVVQVAPES